MRECDYVAKVVDHVLRPNVRKATAYVLPTKVIKATRKLYAGKVDKHSRTIDLVVTIGKPNYEDREFIKDCQKVDEPFPIADIQLKFVKNP